MSETAPIALKDSPEWRGHVLRQTQVLKEMMQRITVDGTALDPEQDVQRVIEHLLTTTYVLHPDDPESIENIFCNYAHATIVSLCHARAPIGTRATRRAAKVS